MKESFWVWVRLSGLGKEECFKQALGTNTQTHHHHGNLIGSGWSFRHDLHGSVGLMDKASASGAGDSRFESWADHMIDSDSDAKDDAMLCGQKFWVKEKQLRR